MNRQFKAKLFDELELLFPDFDGSSGVDRYQVAAAHGTYAGVHVMMTGLEPGIPVSFEVRGPNKKYKLLELIPVPVEMNSGAEWRSEWVDGKYNPHVIRRAPFMIYDALKPFGHVIMARGTSMSVAFRCKVVTDGYDNIPWEITVSHNGVIQKLTFVVEAFTTVVEDAGKDDHKYVNWLTNEGFVTHHRESLYTEKWYELFEGYVRLLHYGRQNMLTLLNEWMFDYDEEKRPIFNEARSSKIIEIAEKNGLYWLHGMSLTGRPGWDADTAEIKGAPIPGRGEAVLKEAAEAIYQFLKKKDLLGRWFQGVMDEPLTNSSKVFHLCADIVRKAMPGIPILDATIAREPITGAVDIWCPTVDKLERYAPFFETRRDAGERFFVYTCLQPAGEYCNRLMDMERLRQVWLGWAPAKYTEVEGYLHWGGNWFGDDSIGGTWGTFEPFYLSGGLGHITDYDLDRSGSLPPGDNSITYPGYNEPLSSTRLEAHRIGFEDLQLLQKLQKADAKKVNDIVAMVFRGYGDFEKSVARYREVKRMLLIELEPKKQKKIVNE